MSAEYVLSLRLVFFFFFFSSRRRHTRWTGDWSSDVCSSDLSSVAVRAAPTQLRDAWTTCGTPRRNRSCRHRARTRGAAGPQSGAVPVERIRFWPRRPGGTEPGELGAHLSCARIGLACQRYSANSLCVL